MTLIAPTHRNVFLLTHTTPWWPSFFIYKSLPKSPPFLHKSSDFFLSTITTSSSSVFHLFNLHPSPKKIHWWSMISQEKTSVAISFHSFSSPIFIQFPIIYAPTNNNKKSHSPLFWSPILFYFLFFRVYLLLFFLGVIASTAVLVIKTLCKACILIC